MLVFLTHLVQAGQAKGLKTSIIAFDIAQFFPSNYLVGIYTQYSWNSFLFGAHDTDVDVGQDSALFSILSVLYIAPLICIFEHRAQAFHLNTSIFSFVDNGLLISQRKT